MLVFLSNLQLPYWPVQPGWNNPWLDCCSVTQSCLILCDPIDWSAPGFPVLHYLLEFVQTHVHCVGDAIQPSFPPSALSPHALSLSQHHGLLSWVSSSHQVAKVLELQHQSSKWIFRVDFLQDGLTLSPCHPRDSQKSPPTPQLKSTSSSGFSLLYGSTSRLPRVLWGPLLHLDWYT